MTALSSASERSPHQRLTVSQAAELYNIPPWKFWRAIRAGHLPSERLLNGRIYLTAAAIDAVLAQRVGG